ncbi:30S ribosomal protein S6 [Treponema pedis str. T A4]|uniref:Small ribosomal subunit protein bS6 n=2 Tax=Treponema pedis TaxID=409322 RepID=S5ZMW9_9SPIR|nr:30S ribosomal protein S6 [Treponema pedis str. T A4]
MTVFPVEEDLYKPGMDSLRNILTEFGVEIISEEPYGDRDLAYEIKRKTKGRYTLFNINADPARMIELDKRFKLIAQMLTYLFIRVEE